jgi:quercetin dioxygenase-like cupin family protein
MEIIRKGSATTLSKPGVQSEQLLFPQNSPSRRITITRVTVSPQAINAPHRHSSSEQVWIALAGRGTLLLDEERTESFAAGDVARFAEGDLHGLDNTGDTPFVYIAVTSPPIDFSASYARPLDSYD